MKLNYKFSGYTLWLDVHDDEGVYRSIIDGLEEEFETSHIERPHITLVYGAPHTLYSAQQTFTSLKPHLQSLSSQTLTPIGLVTDTELYGVNGGKMDMIWSEISLKANPTLEGIQSNIGRLFSLDDGAQKKDGSAPPPETSTWRPHLSLAYDEPSGGALNLKSVVKEFNKYEKVWEEVRIKGVSLWDMNGRIEEWKCIDEVVF
ncbi:hypothetical protein TrLO_g6333 [Triparma laevis f. longispina]|uniref:Uncharacterized protein n=1 Tax=Triparma laevis f. longispina TaxID=1714387 RepID=A0A9W7CF54_9STRA|nr:hypothetical protein TrLO_g6333 [Triparma laevis f. longispina]